MTLNGVQCFTNVQFYQNTQGDRQIICPLDKNLFIQQYGLIYYSSGIIVKTNFVRGNKIKAIAVYEHVVSKIKELADASLSSGKVKRSKILPNAVQIISKSTIQEINKSLESNVYSFIDMEKDEEKLSLSTIISSLFFIAILARLSFY